MNTPRQHAALIKAWADGAEIECRLNPEARWIPVSSPVWEARTEYRIKPTEPDYGEIARDAWFQRVKDNGRRPCENSWDKVAEEVITAYKKWIIEASS